MEITKKTPIGEVVAEDYRIASVFESLGIDFCCKGDRTINEVCEKQHIDSTRLLEDIKKMLQGPQIIAINDYNNWTLDKLAQHIEDRHHQYAERQIPVIKELLDEICTTHSKQHSDFFKIQALFNTSVGEFTMHMKREELLLFPFIKKMAMAKSNDREIASPHFGTVQNSVQKMMNEHDHEGERFRQINELTENYTLPQGASEVYKICFATLKEFEEDLHLHIHLENNILFPKAIELEQQLKNS